MRNLSKLIEQHVVEVFSEILLKSSNVAPFETGLLRSSGLLEHERNELYGIDADSTGNVSLKKLGSFPHSDRKLKFDFQLSLSRNYCK